MGSEAPVAGAGPMPGTGACFSWSAQICRNESESTQAPSQRGHSRKLAPPTTTAFICARHRGQSSGDAAGVSTGAAFAPQWEQNLSPTNISPKQEGQATVARRAPQCSQRAASVDAGAPHMGHLSVSAGIGFIAGFLAEIRG
jgi:hypothetical protein